MKKRMLIWLTALALCLAAAVPALAARTANTFLFKEKTVTLFEGDTFQTELRREGVYDGDGEIRYSSAKESVATISEDGLITAVKKGETTLTVSLIRKGKRVGKEQMKKGAYVVKTAQGTYKMVIK